ncbi:MAG: heme exporter protein D [Porticoccus sp.]|jgi:heme exporter protein D
MFQFENFNAFLYMGGHGYYVWVAYFASLGVLAFLLIAPFFRRKNIIKEMKKQRYYDSTGYS